MLNPLPLGTPTPLISSSLYVDVMKRDGVSRITDEERGKFKMKP